MYLEFNNISEARQFSKYFYRLFVHKDEGTIFIYNFFECEKGKGWVDIPKGSMFMRHKRRSNFKDIFDRIKPILSPIFTTPMREVKADMIDSRRLDVNQLMRDNCTLRTKAYLYKNGHILKAYEQSI